MVDQPTEWRSGDAVMITCDGETIEGTILLASPNSVSLMLGFEAILAEHVGMMPVLRHKDGVYRSIVNRTEVGLRICDHRDP